MSLFKVSHDGGLATYATPGSAEGWSSELYYHGTGHCGCLTMRSLSMSAAVVLAIEWCGVSTCATRGIFKYEHLNTISRGGMFVSFTKSILLMSCVCMSGCSKNFTRAKRLLIPFFFFPGHFFTPVFKLAKAYARFRSPKECLLFAFLCRVRNAQFKGHDVYYVDKDEHYLSLVCHQEHGSFERTAC